MIKQCEQKKYLKIGWSIAINWRINIETKSMKLKWKNVIYIEIEEGYNSKNDRKKMIKCGFKWEFEIRYKLKKIEIKEQQGLF